MPGHLQSLREVTGEPRWISKKALLLHEESLATFGGASGLRDEGCCGSRGFPCSRARKNHAFVDGNKRTASLSIGMFLALNGLKLVADQVDAIHAMLAVAAGNDERSLSTWIDKNSVPR